MKSRSEVDDLINSSPRSDEFWTKSSSLDSSLFQGKNRIIIDVDLLHCCATIHLPANATTQVVMQGW
jgi:hypothetical protein